jgi:hypothetical protein
MLLGGVFCTLQFACMKHHADDSENHEPIPVATIAFTSPSPGAVYTNGAEVTVKARAISTADIHGFDLAIRKAGDSSSLYFIHIHDHNDTININEKWTSQVPVPSNLEVEITAYLDHQLHTKKEKVGFRVQ